MKYLLIAAMLLSACSLGKRPVTEVYTLKPETSITAHCTSRQSLQVAELDASPGLETRRIAVMQGTNKLNYYNGARWTAPAPEMLQGILVEAFEKAHAFSNVSTDAQDLSADLVLMADLRDYQVESDGTVHIRLVAKLIGNTTRKTLATIQVDKSVTPAVHKMDSIIEAFNQASSAAAAEVMTKSMKAVKGCR